MKIENKPKSVLALDIDGTITHPNNPEFANESSLQIIQKLHEMGHIAVPVTGKPKSYAERLFKPNNLEFKGSICENGAVYVRPGESGYTIFGGGGRSIRNP